MSPPAVLAVHGGAGVIRRGHLGPEREARSHAGLRAALEAGYACWKEGGAALDIAVAAVCVLEDDPLFNAGCGSVFTAEGRIEMDAAVMRGIDRGAGAVAGVTTVRNPILLARAVMEKTPFVFLAGPGAEAFAREAGFPETPPEYFATDERWGQLQAQRAAGSVSLSEENAVGTVGAVARDRDGHLAAATSTGGMTNKRWGRIGDSPVIGAGTWADDAACAVSATGHGEFFLRCAVAHEIAARIAYRNESLPRAADAVVQGALRAMGGAGGVIALDRAGRVALSFNCPGMYRGVVTDDGGIVTAIYGEG